MNWIDFQGHEVKIKITARSKSDICTGQKDPHQCLGHQAIS